jgi:predicted nucleic acid-binding protein
METSTLIEPDYFFDTTVLVAYFKKEDQHTHEIVTQVLDGQGIASISVITIAEIVAASDMDQPELRDKRLALLDALTVVPIDRTIAERDGELRRVFHLELPDALIAACAEQAGGQFLTKDPHFGRLITARLLTGQAYN